MVPVHTLVPEHLAHLVDPVESADDEPLQEELVGDPELHVDVQRVVVGIERSRVGASGDVHEDRGVDLEEAVVLLQDALDLFDDAGALEEYFADFGVHDQVDVALAVSQVGVNEAAPLVGEDLDGFGEEDQLLNVDGDLLGLGLEHLSGQADYVAYIIGLEPLILFLPDVVAFHVALDPALFVLEIKEGCLAHDSFGHDASGAAYFHALHGIEILTDVTAVCCDVPGLLEEGVPARFSQVFQLLAAYLALFAELSVHVLIHFYTCLPLLNDLCRCCRALASRAYSVLCISRISNFICPLGTVNSTLSFTLWPMSAEPIGDSTEILAGVANGSASVASTRL